MKAGDYVRFDGEIAKIRDIKRYKTKEDIYVFDRILDLNEDRSCNDNTIYNSQWKFFDNVKSSPNIIDLIDKNDFVEIEYYSNRYKERVSRIFEVDFIKDRDVCFENGHCRLNIFYGEWSTQDKKLKPIIKSIVTKEQFEAMKYEL